MLRWLAAGHGLAQVAAEADAETLIAEDRLTAYSEARQRQQDAHNAETFAHWGRVARAVGRMTGKRVGLDAATRMAMDADFNERGEPSTQERAPMLKMDQIDELIRILGEQGIEPEPPRGRSDVLSFPNRRRRSKGRR